MNAEVTIIGFQDMQVCVPKTWTDEEVLEFAEKENSCGTKSGWAIRKEGDKLLEHDAERMQCHSYEDNCHIMLDA